jgi:hypothetical protein
VACGEVTRGGPDIWGEEKDRFGFNARAAFNVEAAFHNLGGAAPATVLGPALSGYNHDYDDGYNRPDLRGIADGATWNWGYDRIGQIDGTTLAMSSTSVPPGGRLDSVSDDPHWGGEVTYHRELGWTSSYWYGLAVGLSYQNVRFRQSTSFYSDAVRVTDRYEVRDPLPPAPYRGTAAGPGPLLGDTPTRSTTILGGAALTSGSYDLDAAVVALRMGLSFETPFADWIDLQFGGGAIGAVVQGTFSVYELTSVADLRTSSTTVESEETDFIGGAYAEVGLSVRIERSLYVLAGLQYAFLSDYTQTAGERVVELDMRGALIATLGMTFTF